MNDVGHLLAGWANFYVIAGSSAAALTGLMFVVVTLSSQLDNIRVTHDGISIYSTPSVVHFVAAFVIAVGLSAPWESRLHVAVLVAVLGVAGCSYQVWIGVRARNLNDYTPDLEDWVWYVGFPALAYAALCIAGIACPAQPGAALFVIGAVILLLIVTGVHNAWDVVTYLTKRSKAEGAGDG